MERVDLMLSQECNTHCIFCYLYGFNKIEYDFSTKKALKTLEDGAKQGYKEVYISGGEPTLNPDLAKIISRAKSLGFDEIKIMTNGLRLSYEKYLKKLAKSGLNHVAFSLHGADSKTHDAHTGYNGSFNLILQAIENCLMYKGINVELNTVVTKINIGKMDDVAEFALKKGISHLHFQLVVPNSPASKKLFPHASEIKKMFPALIEKFKDKIEDIDCAFVPFCYMHGYEDFVVKLDIAEKFFSNCADMFESWKESLLENKEVKDECRNCRHFKFCRGHWKA